MGSSVVSWRRSSWWFADDQVVGHLLRSLSRILLRVTFTGDRLQYPVNLSPFLCVFSRMLNLFVTCKQLAELIL